MSTTIQFGRIVFDEEGPQVEFPNIELVSTENTTAFQQGPRRDMSIMQAVEFERIPGMESILTLIDETYGGICPLSVIIDEIRDLKLTRLSRRNKERVEWFKLWAELAWIAFYGAAAVRYGY